MSGARISLLAGAALLLVTCVLLLGSAISQAGEEERLRRSFCLLLIGVLGLTVAFLKRRDGEPSRLDQIIAVTAAILPVYALLQVIPLPVALVGLVSPARGELVKALAAAGGVPSFTSLSVVPGITFTHFILITGYTVVFFSIRTMVRSFAVQAWFFVLPVLVAGVLETAAAMIQISAGVDVHGTFPVRNHFAGLLTMALPCAVAWLLSLVEAGRRNGFSGTRVAIQLVAALVLAAFLLLGIGLSLSRGGFVSALVSVVVLAVLAAPSGMSVRGRLVACAVACLALFSGLFYLTPMALVQRLAEHSSAGRIDIWRNTLDLIRAYPLTGCGLGGYESAMLRFKNTVLLNDLDYAHNDYLQFMAELGVVGLLAGAALFGSLLVRTVKATAPASFNRWIAVGCAGALSAILTHSMLDFNLYVPANALVLAWISGVSAGLPVEGLREGTMPTEVLSGARNQSMRSR